MPKFAADQQQSANSGPSFQSDKTEDLLNAYSKADDGSQIGLSVK